MTSYSNFVELLTVSKCELIYVVVYGWLATWYKFQTETWAWLSLRYVFLLRLLLLLSAFVQTGYLYIIYCLEH